MPSLTSKGVERLSYFGVLHDFEDVFARMAGLEHKLLLVPWLRSWFRISSAPRGSLPIVPGPAQLVGGLVVGLQVISPIATQFADIWLGQVMQCAVEAKPRRLFSLFISTRATHGSFTYWSSWCRDWYG